MEVTMKSYKVHNEGVSTCTINSRKQAEASPIKPRAIWPRKQSFYETDTKGRQEREPYVPLPGSWILFLI